MWDVWRYYRRTRFNPENPDTPVVVEDHVQTWPGGALNVHANWPGAVFLPTANWPDLLLIERCAPCADDLTATAFTAKTRVHVDGDLLYRLDHDVAPAMTLGRDRLERWLFQLRPDILVLADYGKGAIGLAELLACYAYAYATGAWLVLDAKPRLLSLAAAYPGLEAPARLAVKGNAAEAQAWNFGVATEHLAECIAVRLDATAVLVTDGPRGAWVWAEDRQERIAPVLSGDLPRSVCGAGDVATAVFADHLAHLFSPFAAAEAAVVAATQAVYTKSETLRR
jgi:bifunctional ADP-heptose synthase (sugar kinase/adenylyltransferase)